MNLWHLAPGILYAGAIAACVLLWYLTRKPG